MSSRANCSAAWREGKPAFGQSRLGLFEILAEAMPHFRRRGVGERHHQDLVNGAWIIFIEQPGQAAVYHGLGLARPRAGDDQHIAPGGNGPLLLRRG